MFDKGQVWDILMSFYKGQVRGVPWKEVLFSEVKNVLSL